MKQFLLCCALLCAPALAHGETIRSQSGAVAQVAGSAAGAFQCLVNKLDASGYTIKFMGGYRRHGSIRRSKHPAGLALDINQYARNVTRPHIPGEATGMAAACGVFHGAQWRNADGGHFEIGGSLYIGARRHRRHRR